MQKRMTASKYEETLCGWCGKPLNTRMWVLHNGEWICQKCKHGYIREHSVINKIWEGVKNGTMAEGSR